MFNRALYSVCGVGAGLLAPAFWLVWRAYASRTSWWNAWLKTEFSKNADTYALIAVWSVLLLGVAGYLLGRRHDLLEHEARSTRDSNLELNALANTDGLTGLLNARAAHERLAIEMENAHSVHAPLSCLLIDIDHFKKINDTYGHPFGDAVLARVAAVLRRQVRRLDMVGRLGGEEFLVIMPGTKQEAAQAAAERIRSAMEREPFAQGETSVQVTVSLGVVRFPAAGLRSKDDLLRAVDEALYAAKSAGRNRVLTWAVGSS